MQRPLLAVAALYVAGVLLGEAFPFSPVLLIAFAILAAVAILLCGWLQRASETTSIHSANLHGHPLALLALIARPLQITSTVLAILLTGWAGISRQHNPAGSHDLRMLIPDKGEIVSLRGTIVRTPDTRIGGPDLNATGRLRFPLDVNSIQIHGQEWQPAIGRVLVETLPPTGLDFHAGRHFEVDGVISPPRTAIASGLFDQRLHLKRHGIYFTFRTDRHSKWNLLDRDDPPSRPLVDNFRAWATNNLARGLPEQDEPLELLWAMSLGWRTALNGEVKEPFMHSGTMHLFAISGLHIAMVAGILVALLTVMRLRREHIGWVAIPLLWFYTAATGWQPSAVRATIMMTIIIFGWSLKRPVDLLNSIGAAAFLILLWDPQQLFQASFQLSFTVVFGLALVLPPLVRRLRPWVSPDPMLPRALWPWWRRAAMTITFWFLNAFATSVTAWLASAPLIACYFNLFTPVAIIANVPVVLCGMLALMSCLGSLLCGAILLVPLAELFNHSAWFFMSSMIFISDGAASLPGAFEYVRAPGPEFIAVYYVMLFGLGSGLLLRKKVRWWSLGFLLLTLVVGGQQWRTDQTAVRLNLLPGTPAVFQEENAMLPSLLVDSGDTLSIRWNIIPILRSRGVDGLESVVLTHSSKHQSSGLTNLVQILPPREVHRSHAKMRTTKYTRAFDKFFAQYPHWDQRINVGDFVGPWEVLHPHGSEDQSRNIDDAVVLRAEFHGVRVLLLSDLGELGQESLVTRVKNLRADLVVASVPNHGEPIQPWLLEAIRPRVVLLHDSWLPLDERAPDNLKARLSKLEVPVFYTTEQGGLCVEILSAGWQVSSRLGVLWNSRWPAPE